MIRSLYCHSSEQPIWNLSPEQMRQAAQDTNGLLWVHLEQPSDQEFQTILNEIFHFHPLAIEDCQSNGYQSPKLDNFGSYLFFIVHGLRPGLDIQTTELDCFLSKNYLVTCSLIPDMPFVRSIWQRVERDERLYRQGADWLCYALLDEMIDGYMPLIDAMDEEIDQLEDHVLAHPQPDTLTRILALKHNILTLRRIIIPQREVLNRLSRDDMPQISPQRRIYYRDIYDHLVRIHDLSESVRDVVSGALDIYLSATSNRLNEVMKALTIVSTIFLPLSFLAGVYGMNFVHMPELQWPFSYSLVWASFAIIAGGMLLFFKRRGWL